MKVCNTTLTQMFLIKATDAKKFQALDLYISFCHLPSQAVFLLLSVPEMLKCKTYWILCSDAGKQRKMGLFYSDLYCIYIIYGNFKITYFNTVKPPRLFESIFSLIKYLW